MPRTLSKDPAKRRRQIFQNIYLNYYKWESLVESDQMQYISYMGEEIYFYDLLIGLDDLPPRQRQAFELHLLQGLTEVETSKVMSPDGKWPTVVGQYCSSALIRMIDAYDHADRRKNPRTQSL